MKKNKEILKAASECGTILFKGFEILSGEEWASILKQSGLAEAPSHGVAATRKLIVGSGH
jgi:hypothetical protein